MPENMMNELRHALRSALRTFSRTPRFTLKLVLVLVLGIGLSMPLLSLVRAGLDRQEPYASPAAVLGIEESGGFTAWTEDRRTPSDFQEAGLDALMATLLALTLFVLAIACVNLAILLLSRAAGRRREMAVRTAIGASPGWLGRDSLAEGAALGVVGLGLGAVLAFGGVALLRASWPRTLPDWLGPVPGPGALAVGAGVPLAVVLLFAVGPIVRGPRSHLAGALRAGAHVTASRGEGAFRRLLVVLAVGATALLLTGAGLLVRGSWPGATDPDPAVVNDDVVLMLLDIPNGENLRPETRLALYEALLERIGRVPNTDAESIASPGAWAGLGVVDRDFVACGRCFRGGLYLPIFPEDVRHHVVGPAYFDTLNIPVLAGRAFAEDDRHGAPRVAIVNDTFAKRSFEGGEPVGRMVQLGGIQGAWYTVVGVVEDRPALGIGSGTQPVPAIYLSALQHPPDTAVLAVRIAGGEAQRVASRIVAAVHDLSGPAMGVGAPFTLAEGLARLVAPTRWFSRLFGGLAALAVVLAAVGLYGVLEHSVRRRTREIGIRMAVGARGAAIVRLVLGEAGRLTLYGTVLGFWGALGLVRGLQRVFEGVPLFDVRVYGGVTLLLAFVALAASSLPARRATRVDPAAALRAD